MHSHSNPPGTTLGVRLTGQFKARAIACYQAASPALARMLRDDIAATYGTALPSALTCLQDDFEACIAHLWSSPTARPA